MRIIEGLPRQARQGELVALDVEIFQQEEPLHIPTGIFACLSIALEAGERYQLYDTGDIKTALTLLSNGQWVMQNAMYDIRQLRRWAPIKQRPIWDTMIMEQDLFGGYFDSFSLDALSRRWLGKALKKDVRESFATATKMTQKTKQYAIKDADATLKVAMKQREYMEENNIDPKWYWDIDEPCIWTVMDMQPATINIANWHKMADEFEELGKVLEEDLGFNVYSPKQVKAQLYRVLNRKFKSTNAKTVLEPLLGDLKGEQYEFVDKILRARMYRKASNTYGHLWPERWANSEGRVRPAWRITGTETGRMACRDPNLQNIPSRKLPIYREQFISAHKRGYILVADVSQQEMRINAYFSHDPALLYAFENDIDIHDHVQDLVASCDNRDDAKALNFGMAYGMTEYGIAKATGMTNAEAKVLRDGYFQEFRGVKGYIDSQIEIGYRKGIVHTSIGRPVHLNKYSRQWQNNAINAPIQGSAADHTKLAMVMFRSYCDTKGVPFPLIMTIHDELVCDIEPGTTKTYRKLIKQAWHDAGDYVIPGIPMKVDIKVGRNWGVK